MSVKNRQTAALVAFNIDRVSEGLDKLKPPADILPSRATAALTEYLDHVKQRLAQMQSELEVSRSQLVDEGVAAPGFSIAVSAHLLDVSEPTVREWMRRGALKQVKGSKPALLELDSVASARLALNEVRDRAEADPDWASSLYDAVESAAIFDSPSVKSGLDQFKRGELEPA